jgi:hypothetical protein
MTKNLKVLWMAATAAALAVPCVRAEGIKLNASVPFAFQVADRQLPSGDYSFVTRPESDLVLVYDAKTGKHVAALLCRRLPAGPSETGQLTFDRHDGQHFLKSIRAADGTGVFLPKTRSEGQAEARVEAQARAQARAHEAVGAAAKTAMP